METTSASADRACAARASAASAAFLAAAPALHLLKLAGPKIWSKKFISSSDESLSFFLAITFSSSAMAPSSLATSAGASLRFSKASCACSFAWRGCRSC